MKNKAIILLYYFVLLLLLTTRQDAVSAPSMAIRIGFMVAVVAPVCFIKSLFYPAIIALFYTLAVYGFAYSYMPYTISIYVGVTVVMVLIFNIKGGSIKAPFFLWAFACYIIMVDFINSIMSSGLHLIGEHSYCLLLLCLFFLFVKKNVDSSIKQLSMCLIIVSLVLSILFLSNKEKFVVDIGEGLERSGWTDPNYFSMTIGIGVIICLSNIFGNEWKAFGMIEKMLNIVTIIVSIITMILVASRGAVLSLVIAIVLLFWLSKVKIGYKIFVLLVASFFVYYLYTNQYFDLLEYRIQSDVGGGSLRTEIWTEKLDAYSHGNIFNLIFGYGHYGGMGISGKFVGSHNDYVGFIVEYGVVGLFLFLYMLFFPIKVSFKSTVKNANVLIVMIYIAVCCFTLEPFGIGSLPFYCFYMYGLLIAERHTGCVKTNF